MTASPEIPDRMFAVLLTRHGGLDALEVRDDAPTPRPEADEVLIKVAAAGMNNTDVNTRMGWYSKSVRGATDEGAAEGVETVGADDATWAGEAMRFPRVQGADCCGRIVAVGAAVDRARIGERVLVRPMHQPKDAASPFHAITYGSERDGAFAQYAVAPAVESFKIDSDWSDAALASLPCAYSTAENMLTRCDLQAERVLITGASGGVGSAAVQLAKRRGAEVIAVASMSKAAGVRAAGADRIVDRGADLLEAIGGESVDVVVDLTAGPPWPSFLDALRRGGRYVTAGAIAGPIVELDVRTMYLKDLTLYGATAQPREVFENLIGYVERNEIKPMVAETFPMAEIRAAQEKFLSKTFTGKMVLIPPA